MCNYQRLVSPNLKSMGNDYELNWCVMKRKFKETNEVYQIICLILSEINLKCIPVESFILYVGG